MDNVVVMVVSDYYLTDVYFPFMPAVIFDALEKAFLDGKMDVVVPGTAFREMMTAYENAKGSK